MSKEQADAIARSLRTTPFDSGGNIDEERAQFGRIMDSRPPPTGVRTTETELEGVGAIRITPENSSGSDSAILYLHGGGYAVGTAAQTVRLPAEIARRTGVVVYSVDYRLAPEDPFPAALDDAVAAYSAVLKRHRPERLAIAGESAGGGLALSTLHAVSYQRLPMPAAALVMSPWVDLTLSGDTVVSKASSDPAVNASALTLRAKQYADGRSLRDPLISPLWGDFAGFPPILIQAGSNEILLDDAVRLAARISASNVTTTLEVTAHVHHVFQGMASQLDEGAEALWRSAVFLSRHLSLAIPVHQPSPAS